MLKHSVSSVRANILLALILPTVLIPLAGAAPVPSADDRSGDLTYSFECGEYSIVHEHGHHEIRLEDFGLYGSLGEPALPGRIVTLAIPPGTIPVSVTVEADSMTQLPGKYRIGPIEKPLRLGEHAPEIVAAMDEEWQDNYDRVYRGNTPYPEQPGRFVRSAGYRKYNCVDVRITPFRYFPQSGQLHFTPKLTIRVNFRSADSGRLVRPIGDDHPRFERTAREFIFNYDSAQTWHRETASPDPQPAAEFVIITTSALQISVGPLALHEMAKGRSVRVVTVDWIDGRYEGIDLAARIRAFLRDVYPTEQWGIQDLLLVGHMDDVPMRRAGRSVSGEQPYTDFYYAELSYPDEDSWDADGDGIYGERPEDGDNMDFYNEVNVGRIPWSDPAVVQSIAEKSTAFELNTELDYKSNIIAMGAFFYVTADNSYLMEAVLEMPHLSDWTSTRMYEDNADYQSPFEMDAPLTRANGQAALAGEPFCFVNWAGHGSRSSAHILGGGGEAFIRSADLDLIDNTHPAIFWALSCSNSDPRFGSCIGRDLLRQGAVGFIGATDVSFSRDSWDEPSDGGAPSCSYWFTEKVTSGEMPQGEAHQYAMRRLYVEGLWTWRGEFYEMMIWTLYGSPGLGMAPVIQDQPVFITGPGPGPDNPPEVRLFSASQPGTPLTAINAYGLDRYGVNVATGDIDGDGVNEIVTGPGPGDVFGPHVRAFELFGIPISAVNVLAYGTNKYGVNVACGDVDNDGIDEIITGAGPGAVFGPHVRGFNYDGGTVTPIGNISFFAYGTRRWGVNPACGDLDGNGRDEIITGAGPGSVFGPHVRAFSYDDGTILPFPGVSFLAYGSRHWGVKVSCGDVDGDGADEIITAPGPGAALGPHIRGFDVQSGIASPIDGLNFFAYDGLGYGATVSCGDVDGDGMAEIITGPGPDPGAFTRVRCWNFDGEALTAMEDLEFDAYGAAVTHGVKTAGN